MRTREEIMQKQREYMRLARESARKRGICVLCSRPAFPDHTMCYGHMIRARRLGKEQYAKERKPTFKEQGLCSWCGEPVVDGYKLCAGCLERARERSRKGLARVDKDKHPWRIEGETRRSKDHDES